MTGENGSKPDTAPATIGRIFCRAVEFTLLFIGLPLVYRFELLPIPMIPTLLIIALLLLVVLLGDRVFPKRQLCNAAQFRKRMTRVLLRFIVGAAVLTAAVLIFEPKRFLSFPKNAPHIWLLVMLLYPLLSVYPQEIVYRAFLFHRYRMLFPRPWLMITASALAFGYMHLVFRNWPAVALSVVAGFLFAQTYERTKSLLVTGLEHALYGDLIFTIGLGWYFFHGSIRFATQIVD